MKQTAFESASETGSTSSRSNFARKLVVGSLSMIATVATHAQVNCAVSNKLACLVPFTTNATANATGLQGSALFNGPIGAQISQLPVASSAAGTTILFVNGNPQSYDNLGPILLDRPDSVGRGRLVIGFNYQSFQFNHLNGFDINSIPFAYSNPQVNADGQNAQTNYFQQTVHVSIRYNQYVALATYGLPKKTDLSVVVPAARISIGSYNLNATEYPVVASNSLTIAEPLPNSGAKGSASGIGDIQANLKHILYSGGEAGRISIASGMIFRFPTGDAFNYLGSGAYGYNLYGLASYKALFSPHVKLAYQWNTTSALLNPTNTPGANRSLPGGAQFGGGVDVGATSELTVSADLLANQFLNSPTIQATTVTIPASSVGATSPKPCPTGLTTPIALSSSSQCTLASITNTSSSYTSANLTLGLKLKPLHRKGLIVYANVLIPLNDVGLRSDPSPSFGASYRFF